MSVFNFEDGNQLGVVASVDTATVVVRVDDVEKLQTIQVNRIVALHSSKPGQHLIGLIQKIVRLRGDITSSSNTIDDTDNLNTEDNVVKIALVGTFVNETGQTPSKFSRSLETVPEILANCFAIEGDDLTAFMTTLSDSTNQENPLELGTYSLGDDAKTLLNGNKFFQRHAVIVGGTGSGKSWTTATLIEQVAKLPNANAILFDIHGEYTPLTYEGIQHFRIAGPSDLNGTTGLKDGVIFLPFWLLGYEAMVSMLVDRSDQNAPNQTMLIAREVGEAKKAFLSEVKQTDLLNNFTVESPVPFKVQVVLDKMKELNAEMVAGSSNREKQGDFHGKLSKLIARIETKIADRRLGFLFQGGEDTYAIEWLNQLALALLAGSQSQPSKAGGVKIIDFSEVPTDILPLVISLVAQLAFFVQQWSNSKDRHPIALICDEAHLYVPNRSEGSRTNEVSVQIFERIAKEGRKYGLGLVIVSQRPSEVNRTVLSQCNNVIAMRLTNGDDQSVIKRLLPDNLGDIGSLLPILDIGEGLVVGDASLLPSRVKILEPTLKPSSGTLPFWDEWSSVEPKGKLEAAIEGWRKQSQPNG